MTRWSDSDLSGILRQIRGLFDQLRQLYRPRDCRKDEADDMYSDFVTLKQVSFGITIQIMA